MSKQMPHPCDELGHDWNYTDVHEGRSKRLKRHCDQCNKTEVSAKTLEDLVHLRKLNFIDR